MEILGGWDVVRDTLRRAVESSAYDAWLSKLAFHMEGETVVVGCPDSFTRNRVRDLHGGAIRAALPEARPIEYRVDPALVQLRLSVEPVHAVSVPVQAEVRPGFDSFVVGPGNALALEAARAVARGQAGRCSPLYIQAQPGLGKSHLCRAIRDALGVDVVYCSSEEFTGEVTGAMRSGQMPKIRQRYRRAANVLILEDVQFLAGKRATQIELFHTLEHLMSRDRTVVLSADRSPREIEGLDPKLASRMASGFVACIAPPAYETRLETLRAKAAGGGVAVPEECLAMLARRRVDNVRDLLAGLNQVVARATLLRRRIDLQLVAESLASVEPTDRPRRVDEIRELVAKVYGLSMEDLSGPSRRRSLSRPRQFAMYLCRQLTEASLKDIGRGFNRDHSSVLYAIGVVEQRVREKPQIRYELEALAARLGGTEGACPSSRAAADRMHIASPMASPAQLAESSR